MAETDNNWQYAHLPVTEWKMAPGTDETNQNTDIEKQQLSKSLFTAAWATGTENKHQTQKKPPKHCFEYIIGRSESVGWQE